LFHLTGKTLARQDKAMEFYKNYLIFTLKGAITVGLLSCIGYTILQVLHNDVYLSTMMSVYVAMVGSVFGLVAASAGFWVLYPVRRHKNIREITFAVSFVLMIICLAIFFGKDIQTISVDWRMVFFPVLPAIVSIFCFRSFVAKHLEALK
jgi:hypothetical protein